MAQLLQTQSQQFLTTPSLSSALFSSTPALESQTHVYQVANGSVNLSSQLFNELELTKKDPFLVANLA